MSTTIFIWSAQCTLG